MGDSPPITPRRILKKLGRVLTGKSGSSDYFRIPWDTPAHITTLMKVVEPYALVDPLRLTTLYGLAREVCLEQTAGDIVECGVCNGGTAAVLAAAMTKSTPGISANRTLWLYDTFEGMPVPTEKDGPLAPEYAGEVRGSMDSVKEVLGKVDFPLQKTVFRKGLFEKTFQEALPDKVALLHVDSDWYESVLQTLRTFYPLVPENGIIVLDDFGHWEGAREAFYDFCIEVNIKPLLERIGNTQAFWRKGKLHTRDTMANYRFGPYRPDYDPINSDKDA